MIDRPFISHFSPQRTDPELLEHIHVQRHDLLTESVARVRESVLTQDKHHLLFIGPRGVGKTHLVRLIHHRLSQQAKTQPELAQRLRFAWLNEDETATSFLRLLILIYRDVSLRYPDEFPAADLQSIYGQSADLAREQLGASLLRHLGSDSTLVVLLENLDSLFKHMPEGEQRIWRAFVQNHPVFATVGTAQSLFDGVSDRNQPFFGFFDTRHLQPLSVEDAVQLLEKLARLKKDDALAEYLLTPTGHARVQAIHDLAGGNPRIYLIFSEFLTKEALDDLVRPFEETADRQLTSYYQERLRWLSAQQQEIIQFLCHHGQPVPVKAIAEGLFTTHNSITGQLKVLREMRYVISNQRGREVFYELAEPLMRLALQIKETHDRRPLTLIVDLLRVWYEKEELERRLAPLPEKSRIRDYFIAALDKLNSGEPNLRHQLLRRGLETFDPESCDDAMLARIQCLAEETDNPQEWLALSAAHIVRKNWSQVIFAASKVVNNSSNSFELVGMALYNRGVAHKALNKFSAAKHDWLARCKINETTPEELGETLISLGDLAQEMGDTSEAMRHLNNVLALSGLSANVYAKAHTGIGNTHSVAGRDDLAILSINQALALTPDDPAVAATALNNRAVAYRRIGELELALNDCDALLAINKLSPRFRALGLNTKATIELIREDYPATIQICTEVVGIPALSKNQLARAYFMRGMAARYQGQVEAALDDFEKPFLLGDDIPHDDFLLPDFFSSLEMVSPQIVTLLLALCHNAALLSSKVQRFLAGFAKYNALDCLAAELLDQLPFVANSPLSADGHQIWLKGWSDASQTLTAESRSLMQFTLQLVRVGIDYLKSKDESFLLTLPLEQRKLLRAALDLPAEPQP